MDLIHSENSTPLNFYIHVLSIVKVNARYFYTAAADLSFYRLDQVLTVWEGKSLSYDIKEAKHSIGIGMHHDIGSQSTCHVGKKHAKFGW